MLEELARFKNCYATDILVSLSSSHLKINCSLKLPSQYWTKKLIFERLEEAELARFKNCYKPILKFH